MERCKEWVFSEDEEEMEGEIGAGLSDAAPGAKDFPLHMRCVCGGGCFCVFGCFLFQLCCVVWFCFVSTVCFFNWY